MLLVSAPAFADLGESGYYRAQSAKTERYAYLLDNTGSYNTSTTSADVFALGLFSGFLRASSDPASVFYITKVSEKNGIATCDIGGQGTSIHSFLDTYVKLWKKDVFNGKQAYWLYAENSGMVKYLGDIEDVMSEEEGYPSAEAKGEFRLWWIDPISATSSDSYFGIAPTLNTGGKYYYPFYAAFGYNAYSDGVKFYTINKIENGVAVLKPVDGVVPEATPVIVECKHPLAVDNKLNVGPSGNKANVSGNLLGGVYFDNTSKKHYNRTKYDKNTMRILTVKNGELTFETSSSLEFLPRNQAYLKVPAGTPADLKVMTESEYAAYLENLNKKEEITAITIFPSSLSLEKGATESLMAVTTPDDPANPDLTWTSSDKSVATVDKDGKVTAVGGGSATITVSADNGIKATANVTVKVMPTGLTISNDYIEVMEGGQYQLSATVTPADCTETYVSWSSSDKEVATVDFFGLVTVHKEGKATITAKTSNGITATCTLNALSGVDEVIVSEEAEVYDLQGNRVKEMQKGQVYIMRLNGTSVKVTK